jgi:heat shock protein 5
VQRDLKMFPFKVVSKDSKPCIEVDLKEGKKVFQAEEISAMILIKMKETAEAYLGRDIKNAVVTVPGELISLKVSSPGKPLCARAKNSFECD